MPNPENKPEASEAPKAQPSTNEAILSKEAVAQGQNREIDARIAAVDQRINEGQAERHMGEAATPETPAAPAEDDGKPKSWWLGLFSSLSAGFTSVSTWLGEKGGKFGDWLGELLGLKPKDDKAPEATATVDANEKLEDTLDLLWPDAPIFSFPKSYAGPIDVSDVMRWRENHVIHGDGRMHNGMDIPAPEGTPILLAASEAEVVTSKFQETINAESGEKDGAGHYVTLKMSDGTLATFMHLSKAGPAVGTKLKKGQVLGYVGTTGGSTGPHIHYEIKVSGERIDPTPYLSDQLVAEAKKEKQVKGVA